jgi:hypothetical protein
MTTSMLRRAGLVALAALLGACGHFVPTVPTRSRSGDVDLELVEVVTGPRIGLVYRSQTGASHAIRRAWLTVPSRAPCSGGAEATEIAVDGQPAPDGVLPAGAHEVRVRLEAGTHFTLDTVVDLQIEDGLCARAPAVSQSLPFESARRTLLVTSIGLNGNGDLDGLRGLVDFRIGAARWAGPVLLSAEAGIGAATCNPAVCGMTKNGEAKSGSAVPLSADARVAFDWGTLNLLTNFGLLGARYKFTPVTLPAMDGDRHFGTHGLFGVLGWAFTDAVHGPFHHVERGPLIEMSIPIGVLVAPELATQRAAFSIGFDMRMLFPL